MKLCSDIYVLTSVADGAPFEDMKDLLSISKLPSHNQSVCGDTNPDFRSQVEDKSKSNGGDVELSLLRSIIANVQADVLQLKEVNKSLKEEFYKDMKVVKDEIKSIKSELSSVLESNRKNSNLIVEIRQIVDRLNDEKSNGVANIRSDIKQIRSEIKASDNANELQIVTINEKLSNIQKIEKRVSKLETKISHDKPLKHRAWE